MKRKTIAFIIVPILLIGAFLFSNFLADKKELPPQRPKPEAKNYVKVQEVKYSQMPIEIEVFGRVGSSQQINLVSEVGGKLVQGQINLKEGESFRKGQVLARVNNKEQKLTLQSRKSNFLNLLASAIPDIKIDFNESFDAWFKYFNSIDLNKDLPALPTPMPTKLQTFLASKGALAEYYAIKSLEENLKKFTMIAPYSGSVVSVNLEIGSVVNPGSAIASIIRTDKLELKVPIQQKDIAFIDVGTTVKILQEGYEKVWMGKVIRKAGYIDPNNQSVNIFIGIENDDRDVYDGLYMQAIIPGKYIEEGMKIDRSIIQNKNEVFVVKDNKLKVTQINIAKFTKDQAIINGLLPGDQLVIEAPTNASNDMEVEISK